MNEPEFQLPTEEEIASDIFFLLSSALPILLNIPLLF
jgi:hypothetical protein